MRFLLTAAAFASLCGPALQAAQYGGTVRAADTYIPGATITAQQGDKKVTAFTDEFGRYTMELGPGVWDVKVDMFSFTPEGGQVTIGDAAVSREWVLTMPKVAGAGGTAAAISAVPTQNGRGGRGGGRGGFGGRGGGPGGPGGPGGFGRGGGFGGRGGPGGAGGNSGNSGTPAAQAGRGAAAAAQTPAQPAFQSATVTATPQGQAAAEAQNQGGQDAQQSADLSSEAEDSFLVSGSTSGGLAQSFDDEARRQQMMGGRGGPGGGGGGAVSAAQGMPDTVAMPPGMAATLTNDSLGLGGFGAGAINGGFGVGGATGPGGGAGFGGGLGAAGVGGGPAFAGAGGFGGGGAGGGGGGGGGRGGGGGGGGRGGGGRGRGNAGGPFNGQFASFGNRRRNLNPPLTGSVALTVSNSALNAAPYSLNGQAAQKPYSANNRLNGNIGGPLVIPHIVNWARAQFTVSVSASLIRNGTNMVGQVPTPNELAGDFSGVSNVIYEPSSIPGMNPAVSPFCTSGSATTQIPFPGNKIPSECIGPVAAGLLQYFPNQLYPGITQNYRFVITNPSHAHTVGIRFNAPLNNKDRLNFNFQTSNSAADSHQLFGFEDTSYSNGMSASAGWSHSFAPRFNNSATFSLSRSYSEGSPFFANKDNIAGDLGIAGVSQEPLNYGPPSISFTNFSSLSDGTPSLNRNQTFTASDTITYVVRRKHNLSFGYSVNRLHQDGENFQNARGSFSFSGLMTSEMAVQTGSTGQETWGAVKGTGYDFADFLLGLPQTASVRYSATTNYMESWSTSAYANDDFRAGAGLTLNFGLRYEYFAPYIEERGHLASLLVNPQFTGVEVVTSATAGTFGLPGSIVRNQPHDFSPRLGLAWRPSQKHGTIIRSGYSIFYSGSSYAQIANSMAAQPQFATTGTFTNVSTFQDPLTPTVAPATPFIPQNAFTNLATPTAGSALTNTFAINPDFRIAYAQTWNFSIQNSLPGGIVLDTEYIGTKGTNLGVVEDPNRTGSGASSAAIADRQRGGLHLPDLRGEFDF